ncbi:MAG: coenzyme F420-0:L-glutamate ligase [Alphaproteobacteria bacterium]|jgi:putative folate metabolism gamma-glutamate ligase|nr:coenzyme F420-0:L-glutamate ligase [Alphaproteobacteria bacterium]
MQIKAIKTHLIEPGDSLHAILDSHVLSLKEGMIVCITSKIISLCQGRVVPKDSVGNKYALVKEEADAYLTEQESLYEAHLTIKNNILIPSAGIDESNGDGIYILYPHKIQETAQDVWQYLKKKHHLTHLGILITDSHTTPLRKGVTGVALGWCGFAPLHSYVGQPDLYDHPLRVTQINILDALATSCVFVMGEGAEQTPLALIEAAPKIQFLSRPPTADEEQMIQIPLDEDIYGPLLKNAPWIWNKRK